MNKRGQIFLVAAIIIAGALIGFGYTYSEATITKKDNSAANLANEMKYELWELTGNALYNSLNFSDFNKTLKNVTEIYSKLNPDKSIYVFFDGIEESWTDGYYFNGVEIEKPLDFNVTYDNNSKSYVIIEDKSRKIYYNLSLNNLSMDLYVMIIKDGKEERYVALR